MTTTDHVVVEALASAFADGDAAGRDGERRHAVLVARAERDGLLDVSYRTADSPLGPLLVAATPAGVVRVAFDDEGHDAVLDRLAADISPRILRGGTRLDATVRQLDEYFAGERRTIDVDVDLQLAHGFRRVVLVQLRRIPYGTTASYAVVAHAVGHDRAVRAVGTACATNPVPLIVPCHRVVRSDGTIGQYRGGTPAKRTLLALESAAA